VLNIFDISVDVLFLFDILVNFRTTFYNTRGEEVYNPKQIATNYIKSSFLLDILSCIPFDDIFEGLFEGS
jgi:hypothetical protein